MKDGRDEILINALAKLMEDEKYDAIDLFIHRLYANSSSIWAEKIVESAKFEAYGDDGY